MLLAVDIGNTHICVGCMRGLEIVRMVRLTTNKLKTDFEYAADIRHFLEFFELDGKELDGAILSSVVPPVTNSVARAVELAAGIKPLILGKGVKTGVNILIDDPAQAGADLIAAAAGALKLYAPPLVIIDMGTATTISVINKQGSFMGGTIAPGVALGLSALSSGTSQLPNISLEAPGKVLGTNTVDSMRSGAVLGAAAMLDGMIDRVEEELGEGVFVVATGGIASSIVPLCKREITVNDDLLLTGLAVIFEKNKKR